MEILRLNIHNVFDSDLYQRVLDPKECHRQLTYLSNSSLALWFIDASAKIPNGMLTLNLADFGDYYECLSIDHTVNDMSIQGKYCRINIPFEQKSSKTNLIWKSMLPKYTMEDLMDLFPQQLMLYFRSIFANVQSSPILKEVAANTVLSPGLKLGLCIPRVCTTKQVENFMNSLLPFPLPKLAYSETFCRLPNDRPNSTADYIAYVVFGTLLLLTLLSTSYDLYQVFIRKKKESPSRLLTSFSVYTNTRRFVNFPTPKNALECVDGIRTLSMIWVMCGHTYIFTFMTPPHNMSDVIQWTTKFSSLWISACPIVVDTFFALSGLFCIYVIPDNITAIPFLKHIHIFYLYRILRVFPLLASMVLLQSSVLNWISDGPDWEKMAMATESCRQRWWSTLLHIQNIHRPLAMCVFQSWYIAVDTQLYLLSPLIIVFLLSTTAVAWIVLTLVGVGSLAAITTYTFTFKFPSAMMNAFYTESFGTFFQDFYLNTLTRASPFVIGIIFGYILKQNREKKIQIQMKYVLLFWSLSAGSMAYCFLGVYETLNIPYNFTMFDAILNSTMRGLWGAAVCWIIVACIHGYGGPINWLLSLPMWKLPARMSYAVYLIHLQILQVMTASVVKPPYFTEMDVLYDLAGVIMTSMIIGFAMCILIDAPASTLVKLVFMPKQPSEKPKNGAAIEDNISNGNKSG